MLQRYTFSVKKQSVKFGYFAFYLYLCVVNDFTVHIITNETELPALNEENFFHSRQLFEISRKTPRQKPYMAIVRSSQGHIMAHLLGIVRYRTFWLPPYLYMHCRILGEGVYCYPHEGYSEAQLFVEMIDELRTKLGNKTLYIEVSHFSQKMFAYRELRQREFFPVNWMSIHNSLHSHAPEERLSDKLRRHIKNAYAKGVITDEVKDEDDMKAFFKLMKKHHILKPKRHIPDKQFFVALKEQGHGRLYLTRYRDYIVGCSAVTYNQNNAYLWYMAFRRKSFAFIHPDELTLWHVLKDSHQRGYDHVFFLDVGLPFSHNPFREFILSFGGKPVSTYRWFRFSIRWINTIMSWIYRD